VAVARGTDFDVIGQKEELAQILRQHMDLPTAELGYPKTEKLQLGIAALASILFIAGVWFSFTRGMYTLTTLEIPVEYMNFASEMEILDTSVNAVRLDLSGSGALIKSIRPEQVHVRLDLSKGIVGHNVFNITPESISLPPGVLLKTVEPSTIEVTLDIPIRKQLPVQVDWVGKLPEHLVLVEVKLDPEEIQVMGGKRILHNMSTVYTEKVPLDNISKSGTMTISLALNPASLRVAEGSKDKVTVAYVVKKRSS